MDRTAPILPLRPGLPEKATHDYRRHGTTLFAVLEVATGEVTDACYPRDRSDEFLRFPIRIVIVCRRDARQNRSTCAIRAARTW